MYLLDTNICIYCMKDTYPCLTEKLFSMRPEELYISTITLFELEYGAAKSQRSEQTQLQTAQFLAPFNIAAFTSRDAVCAGKLRCYLEKKGFPIGPYDIQIAAQAVTHDLTLVTHNTKEFERVPCLKLEDWAKI